MGDGKSAENFWRYPADFLQSRREAVCICVLVISAFLSRYLFAVEFGFYEDDWLVIAPSLKTCGSATNYAFTLPYRFLSWPLFDATGCAIQRIGLPGVYIAALAIYSVLLYALFCFLRLLFTEPVALVSSVLFSFLPFDTTHAYLTHVAQLQPALILMLVSAINLIKGRYILVLIFSILSMLIYDGYIVVLLATVIALVPPTQIWRRKGTILVAVAPLVGYLALRQALWNSGESYRSLNLSSPLELFLHIADGVAKLLGYMIKIPQFAFFELLQSNYVSSIILGIAVGAIWGPILFLVLKSSPPHEGGIAASSVAARVRYLGSLFLMGLGSLILVVSVRYYPELLGRSGRYFTVASIFVAVVISLCLSGLARSRSKGAQIFGLCSIVLLLGFLSGYALVVQRQLVTIAEFQFKVVGSMFRLLTDYNEKTRVIILDEDLWKKYGRRAMITSPYFGAIGHMSYFDTEVLSWSKGDIFFHTRASDPRSILKRAPDGGVLVNVADITMHVHTKDALAVAPRDVVFLRLKDGFLERLDPFVWDGEEIGAPRPSTTNGQWRDAPLTKLGKFLKARAESYRTGFPN